MDKIPIIHIHDGLLILAIALSVYYVPTVIAKQRRHNNTLAIFVLNSLPLFIFAAFFLVSLLVLGSIVPDSLVPVHALWTTIGAATVGVAVSVGWTVVSWSVALVWSCTNDTKEQLMVVREPTFKREPA
ncbi:hypothetical protein [Paraburkholderia sp. HD33-4]|uniref:hypothetical protein n=1 Tax=Paraburkholderia sp. HD33-4 TaxID=2883242 RepID=UPI001F1CD112|nr:hypothetical protein [Paraburkholderia sp. HD33-4]